MGPYFPFTHLGNQDALLSWSTSDESNKSRLITYIQKQLNLPKEDVNRRPGQMFWPPRIIRAMREGTLVPFIGTGVSIPAGLPDWIGLLHKVGLDPDVENDPQVKGDMLTLAEVTALVNGPDSLQTTIRRALIDSKGLPTTGHFLLANMHLPLYITTNYDKLLENAILEIYGKNPSIITKDSDLLEFGFGRDESSWIDNLSNRIDMHFVVKLHGCISRHSEHLILTRSDYRRHYRENKLLLSFVRKVLSHRHILFMGFSHKDPEVSRLIEDVIYENGGNTKEISIPGLYSLQFDMLKKTPEIFAARGIVALTPSLVVPTKKDEDTRGEALLRGISDLFDNSESQVDKDIWLDSTLFEIRKQLNNIISNILRKMASLCNDAQNAMQNKSSAQSIVDSIRNEIGEYANQGIYFVDHLGRVICASCPTGLDAEKRIIDEKGNPINFSKRPYFRQANSLRINFVSDSFESVFNKNATISDFRHTSLN
jgi:hypothetical protein